MHEKLAAPHRPTADARLSAAPPASDALEADVLARVRRLAAQALSATAAHLWYAAPDGEPGDGVRALAPELPLPGLDGLCGRVAASGRVLEVPDVREQRWVPERHALAELGVAAFLGAPLVAPEGEVLGCLCVVDGAPRDWTAEDRTVLADLAAIAAADRALRRAASGRGALENRVRTLETAVENMQLGVTVTDPAGRIVYSNPAEARMHGYEPGELHGKHARILGPPEAGRPRDLEAVEGAASWTRETVNVRKDGTRFPVLLWSDVVTGVDGRSLGIVTCSEDITQRKAAEQALRDLALSDPLTGLPNRVHFLERLTHAVGPADAASARFAVLFLDLDRFKVVNDSLGHHVGDELLRVTARRLQEFVRPGDTVARFGGDEFAVLLHGVSGQDEVIERVRRLQAALSAPIHLDGYELYTSSSVGIVLGATRDASPELLWRRADMAMYRAKSLGAGRFAVYDEAMHAEALARLELETDLRRAVERGEFHLRYQPIVALRTGRIVGFEALLRWNHPRRGLVLPGEIIPTGEETGLILPIGEWVLFAACQQLKRWQQLGLGGEPLYMAVNLSGKQLAHASLADRLERAMRDAGVAPHTVRLEITESAIVGNDGGAAETLRRLKSLGVQLYLDDFGTGYSSLSYLHRFPLDALKIDRSFISHLEREGKHGELVGSILSLARGVHLPVVAEGVSTAEQLRILRELRCDYAQGFLFAQPLAAPEAEALLVSGEIW